MMNAVFVHKTAVLRDSHIDPESDPATWRLAPATLEAMRLLSGERRLVFLFDSHCQGADPDDDSEQFVDHQLQPLVRQIEAGGGSVDGLVVCPHNEQQACACWGQHPGILWATGSQFDLRLGNCYVLGDSERDIETAYAAGARAMLVLGQRSIAQVQRDRPPHKSYPIAMNLTTATQYIGIEEGNTSELGHPAEVAVPIPPTDELYANPEALPALTVVSRRAHALQSDIRKSRFELQDLTRWLSFFVAGALGLSLGIAYLLTHLYRVQPFPEFAYYVTLQFIPRPIRGALFIITGVAVLAVAVRSFYRSANVFGRLRS